MKTRQQIDARNSNNDPYDTIAAAFNNYEDFQYFNLTYTLEEDGVMIKNDGYTFSFPIVKTLNPQDTTRAQRLGDEIKAHITYLMP